ncbi:zinc finger CCHC domain-containing protein 9-like [Pecten maximus]|uniref:zinc finger CCHC domain-containing protein 9-like n=1 Tax=Pecten maximus TaxID=6579 RepID=UPI00145852B1|nr:zinc finger CCHC domain-containing protein 9-like [Pecten maximus]XP_033730544.1 zinc finger CCHC domain-containing protein 9-like [Pecten maximus]
MTRFARGGSENSKRPLDATPWREMAGQSSQGHQKHRQNVKGKKHRPSHTKVKVKGEGDIEKGLVLALKKETRREDRRVKRIDKRKEEKVCYNCRGTGHAMSECPESKKDIEQGTGICFKCGSTEHASSKCRLKLPAGKFPYAKCFICGEMGHLSKQCPDNPRGLYPMGGCCKICESVEHYERDCPNREEQPGEDRKDLLLTWKPGTSADEEVSFHRPNPPPKKKSGPKLVIF